MKEFIETLRSWEITRIRNQVKERQIAYGRDDQRRLRRQVRRNFKNGDFRGFNRDKIGKWISQNWRSSGDFRHAYADQRSENDYYDTWGWR